MSNSFDAIGTIFMQSTPCYLIILLVLIALVLGVSSLLNHRRLSWRASFTQGLGSLLWAAPVIAVLGLVAMRVAPHYQWGTTDDQPVDQSAPSWLEDEDRPVPVREVSTFSNSPEPVNWNADPATADDELPEWTRHEVTRLKHSSTNPGQEKWRIVLGSELSVSINEARTELAQRAAKLLQEDFNRLHSGRLELTADNVKAAAVRAEAVEKQEYTTTANSFDMYKVYWQVEISPEVRTRVSQDWKQHVAYWRAEILGGVLGLFTLMAGTFAAYFRLDQRSNGAYRTRLKLAALALMTAGALGLLAVLPVA